MSVREYLLALGGFLLSLVILLALYWAYTANTGIRECPQAWVLPDEPGFDAQGNPVLAKEYMLINGLRVEVEDVDVGWVQRNCELTQPEPPKKKSCPDAILSTENDQAFVNYQEATLAGALVYYQYDDEQVPYDRLDQYWAQMHCKAEQIRACPDAWIQNKMPQIVDQTEGITPQSLRTKYFIYDGQRVEYAQVQVGWVQANCSVSPQIVY